MRSLCGPILVVMLGSIPVAASEFSKAEKPDSVPGTPTASEAAESSLAESNLTVVIRPVSMTSSSKTDTEVRSVGQQAMNLRLAVSPSLKAQLGKAANGVDSAKTDGNHASTSGDSSTRETQTPTVLKPLKRQVLVFKASWCGACQSLKYEWPKLRDVRWRIGEKNTDHIQLVDADLHPDLMSQYGVASLPTLVLVEDGRELSRQGSLGAKNIAEFYYGRLK